MKIPKLSFKKLRMKLAELGMRQSELAYRIGVSPSLLTYYFQNKRTPKEGTIKEIARALDCSIDELLEGIDDEARLEFSEFERELIAVLQRHLKPRTAILIGFEEIKMIRVDSVSTNSQSDKKSGEQ